MTTLSNITRRNNFTNLATVLAITVLLGTSAHSASAAQIMGINDGGWFGAAFDEPMPDSVKSVYRAVNNAYQDQKLSVNEYIDAAPYYASIREDLLEWSAINPNWSPTDVQKKIEKLIEPIKAKTRDVIANRNANK